MNDVVLSSAANVLLIVGAGPVGLTLANELLRHGIRCRLIDSAPHATRKTKALAIQPRTQELLAKMGVIEVATARGLKSAIFSPYSDGKRLTRIDYGEYLHDTPYPYVLMLPQHETEALLTEHLQNRGGAIEWQVELINFTQDEQGVEALLRHSDGREERFRTDWLVGCDGAHSAVRHLLGLHFAGSSFEQSFAVGNVHMTWDLPYDEILAFVHRGSFIAYFPMVGERHRVVIAYELDRAPTGDVTLEEIQQVIDICGPYGARADSPTDLARFHVNQRRSEHYTQGRVFLAGDAAHIHSPIGGQGLNTGMQDAFNLGWKLALVAQGLASPRLLETYETEREQVGEMLLRGTGLATRMVLTRNPLLVALRNRLAPLYFASSPSALHRLAESLSEIAVAYHQSSIVRDQRDKKGTLQAGDRAPDGLVQADAQAEPQSLFEMLKSTRSVLLIFAGQQPVNAVEQRWNEIEKLLSAGYQELIKVYLVARKVDSGIAPKVHPILWDVTGELHRRYETEQGGLLLVRPDGYIGFWGQFGATEALRTYVQQVFHLFGTFPAS